MVISLRPVVKMFLGLKPNVKKIPDCKNCKYSFKHNNENYCKLFRYIFLINNETNTEEIFYIKAEECRINDDLCGLSGSLFKKK